MKRSVAAGLVTLALVGCGGDPEITAVRIVAQGWEPRTFDQLRFALATGPEDLDFARRPVVRPPVAAGPLASPQDLVIYLSDALAGQSVRCGVQGLFEGRVVASGIGLAAQDLRKGRVSVCPVAFSNAGPDGGATDAAPTDGLAPSPDAGGDGLIDSSTDGPLISADAPVTDGPPADAPPPGTEVPPPVDAAAPVPDAPVDSPALPVDTAAPPPDTAPPPPPDTGTPPPDTAPPPPDTAPATGCVTGGRRGFIDPTAFPNIASCGPAAGAVTYEQALTMTSAVCAPGWRWCRPADIAGLGNQVPSQIGASCSWLDSSQFACNDRRPYYGRLNCTGAATNTLSAGGPSSGAACTGVDLGCGESWKFSVPLDDRFNLTSVAGGGGPCLNHVTFQCAANLGTDKCWITCCRI